MKAKAIREFYREFFFPVILLDYIHTKHNQNKQTETFEFVLKVKELSLQPRRLNIHSCPPQQDKKMTSTWYDMQKKGYDAEKKIETLRKENKKIEHSPAGGVPPLRVLCHAIY